jgi:stress-induced morphogen
MTGTKDHLAITVVSDEFKGKLLIEQHQILMNLLKEELKNRIHAVKLNTFTKEKFDQLNKR